MPSKRQQAKALIEALIAVPNHEFGLIKEKSDALINFIASIVHYDLNPSLFIDTDFTTSDNGKACSPLVAAKCAQEFMRNYQFQQGSLQAIIEQHEKLNAKRPVHILYAGTGPFGTIVIPILLLLSPEQVQVTLLDIHQDSLTTIKELIQCLELDAFIADTILADASQWEGKQASYDIIVSETMKAMLEQEPQLSVFDNLHKFLTPGGTLIPQKINIQAWLSHAKSEHNKMIGEEVVCPPKLLGEVYSLNKHSLAHYQRKQEISGTLSLDDIQADNALCQYDQIKYTTHIQVYKDTWLRDNQCSLNLPKYEYLANIPLKNNIHYQYKVSQHPEFVFHYS